MFKGLEIKVTIIKEKNRRSKKPVGGTALFVVRSVVLFHYMTFGVCTEQVEEGREKWKIPEREGGQALVEARRPHLGLTGQSTFLNDRFIDFSGRVIADNWISLSDSAITGKCLCSL